MRTYLPQKHAKFWKPILFAAAYGHKRSSFVVGVVLNNFPRVEVETKYGAFIPILLKHSYNDKTR